MQHGFALESMNKDVVWIVGGVDKGNDYSQLEEIVLQKGQNDCVSEKIMKILLKLLEGKLTRLFKQIL